MTEQQKYDVIIVGGSYAGLSAAMSLGRSMRNTLIIDGDEPCNRQTPHSHNFLTQDGKTPKEITQIAMDQLKTYPSVHFYKGIAKTAVRTEKEFIIESQEGQSFRSSKLLFATGIKDKMLAIEGFQACWGISVIHCPYCHGYEYRHNKTGLLANGDKAFHLGSLINNLTNELTIFTNGKAEFSEEQLQKFNIHGIVVVESKVIKIQHTNGYLEQVILEDNSSISLEAMYAVVPFEQHCDLPIQLGCELTKEGYIAVDDFQKTTVPGIFACGDNCIGIRSIARAVSAGNLAGAMVNAEITHENF